MSWRKNILSVFALLLILNVFCYLDVSVLMICVKFKPSSQDNIFNFISSLLLHPTFPFIIVKVVLVEHLRRKKRDEK